MLLAAWIHLRTRNDSFSNSMGGFFLLSVSRGEAKGGQFREMLLRHSLPLLFPLLVWFCGESLPTAFSLPFTIAVGLDIITTFWHSNSCIPDLGGVEADSQSTRPSLMVFGVWDLGVRSQPGSGERPESSIVEAGAFEFIKPACSLSLRMLTLGRRSSFFKSTQLVTGRTSSGTWPLGP